MDIALVKLLMLWIMCENILLTTSMALKEIANEDANTRQKRSPASLFGINLGNPISAAGESFSGIGNIFSGNRENTHHNNYHEQMQHYRQPYERNTNTFSPINIPNRSGIPNSVAQDDFQQGDRYISPQENNSEVLKKTVPDKKQKLNKQPVPARNNEAPENTDDIPENEDNNKQLLDYIFQKPEINDDDEGTTVDNNIDFVTETGEYETTTGSDLGQRMLPAAAVASLLG